jgi:hypothetical protein
MLVTFINLIGWTGVVFLLIAYALVSTKRCSGDSVIYQSLNITGALLLIINSFYFGAYPSVGINIAWVGIGFFTLINTLKKGKATTSG